MDMRVKEQEGLEEAVWAVLDASYGAKRGGVIPYTRMTAELQAAMDRLLDIAGAIRDRRESQKELADFGPSYREKARRFLPQRPGLISDINLEVERARRVHDDERHPAKFEECANWFCRNAHEWATILRESQEWAVRAVDEMESER